MRTRAFFAFLMLLLWSSHAADAKAPEPVISGSTSVIEILKMAKDAVSDITDPKVDKDLLEREIAEAQARAGDIRSAVRTVLNNQSYISILLACIATAQAESGDTGAAFKTLDQIRNPEDRVTALIGIAKSFSKNNEHARAVTLFDQAAAEVKAVFDKATKTRVLRAIASAQWQTGDWGSAYLTVDTIPDAEEKARMLIKLAKEQGDKGNFGAAFRIAALITDENNRSLCHAYLAQIQAQRGDLSAAFRTARAISKPYYCASALTSIAEVQKEKGAVADAVKTFLDARQYARKVRGDDYNKALLLKDLAVSQFKAGQAEMAVETFGEAKNSAMQIPDDIYCYRALALQALAEALARSGDMPQARVIFLEAHQAVRAIKEGFNYRAMALKTIAQSQLAIGESRGVIEQLQEAVLVAQSVPRAGDRALLLVEISKTQADADDRVGSIDSLQRASRAAVSIDSELEQLTVFLNITTAYIRLGILEAALRTADDTRGDGQRADVIGRIAQMQVEDGDLQGAVQIAIEQKSAHCRARALLGVARGMLGKKVIS